MQRISTNTCGRVNYVCTGVGKLQTTNYLFKPDICDVTAYDAGSSVPTNPNNFINIPQKVQTISASVPYHNLQGCRASIATAAGCVQAMDPFTAQGYIDVYAAVYAAADSTLKAQLAALNCYCALDGTGVSGCVASYSPGILQPTSQSMLDNFNPLPAIAIPAEAVQAKNYDGIVRAVSLSANSLQDVVQAATACGQFVITVNPQDSSFAVSAGTAMVDSQQFGVSSLSGSVPVNGSVSIFLTASLEPTSGAWTGSLGTSQGTNSAATRSKYIGSIKSSLRGAGAQDADIKLQGGRIEEAPSVSYQTTKYVYSIDQAQCGPVMLPSTGLPRPTGNAQVLVTRMAQGDPRPTLEWTASPSASGVFRYSQSSDTCSFTQVGATHGIVVSDQGQVAWLNADSGILAQALTVAGFTNMAYIYADQQNPGVASSASGGISWLTATSASALVCQNGTPPTMQWLPYTQSGGSFHVYIQTSAGGTTPGNITTCDVAYNAMGVLTWQTSDYQWVLSKPASGQAAAGGVFIHTAGTPSWLDVTAEQQSKDLILVAKSGIPQFLQPPATGKYVLTSQEGVLSWVEYAECT